MATFGYTVIDKFGKEVQWFTSQHFIKLLFVLTELAHCFGIIGMSVVTFLVGIDIAVVKFFNKVHFNFSSAYTISCISSSRTMF